FATARALPLPVAAFGLAMLLSFIGSIGVRETGVWRQTTTRTLAGLVGALACVVAGALSPVPLAADLGFLVVIFVSVYIRRYGMRWLAIGLVAFMAYFMGQYMHPAATDAGFMLFAAAVALGSAQIASVVLLPDDPERDFRRALRTIDHRINLILDHLLTAAEAGSLPPDDRRTIREQMTEFREIVLMAEGLVPQITGGALSLTGAAADLAGGLIDLLLAVERLVRYRETALPPAAALRALVEARGPRLGPVAPAADDATTGTALRLLEDVRRARGRINAALGPVPSPVFADAPPPAPAASLAAQAQTRSGVPASLHRPIQVTLACGLALAAGLMLSPTRWYWAVITSYLVFNNTRTRADTALRAMNRAAGTLGGVLVGILLATALQGHMLASGLLIPVVIFLAVYNLQTSYGWMIFFFTIALALLYGMMGMFTTDLLVLRLTETLVGGLCGVGTAFFVFPIRSGGEVNATFRAFLDALAELLRRSAAKAAGDGGDVTGAALELDRRYGALTAAVRPLGGPWSLVTRFGAVRTKVLLLVSCAHWARILARAMDSGAALGQTERTRIDVLTAAAEAKIARLMAAGADWFTTRQTPEPIPGPMPPPSSGELKREAAIGALESLNDLLDRAVAQIDSSP
ncbi:MAG: FUSC family protein, partial [Paracoccaceae bacterium]|nr:FUSC family protein [Paracoccaceae bacterium]